MPSLRIRFLLGSLLLLGAAGLLGQDRTPAFSVDVPLVSLDVSVFDSSNHPVINLTRDEFQVFEDGQPREVKSFSSVEAPYNILALFDCTGSTREAWPFLFKSLNGFLATLRPQDRIAVAAFGAGTTSILDWTARSTEPMNVQIRTSSPLCDQTDFYGALASAARMMRGITGRKGAIVFTDGVHGSIPSE